MKEIIICKFYFTLVNVILDLMMILRVSRQSEDMWLIAYVVYKQ